MANVRNSNTYYIDTANQNPLVASNIKVMHISITPTAANGQVVLQDYTTGITKIDLRSDTANRTLFFSFKENPIVFPNGILASTVTNAVCTCTLVESRS